MPQIATLIEESVQTMIMNGVAPRTVEIFKQEMTHVANDLKKQQQALEFYADESKWYGGQQHSPVHRDGGDRARNALGRHDQVTCPSCTQVRIEPHEHVCSFCDHYMSKGYAPEAIRKGWLPQK